MITLSFGKKSKVIFLFKKTIFYREILKSTNSVSLIHHQQDKMKEHKLTMKVISKIKTKMIKDETKKDLLTMNIISKMKTLTTKMKSSQGS
jgi:hypothetical protein